MYKGESASSFNLICAGMDVLMHDFNGMSSSYESCLCIDEIKSPKNA